MLDKINLKLICENDIHTQWSNQPDSFPTFLNIVSNSQKKANEQVLDNFLKETKDIFGNKFLFSNINNLTLKELSQNPTVIDALNKFNSSLFSFFTCENVLNIKENMGDNLFYDFLNGVKDFLRKTRNFDDSLSMDCIWQALRNYLIYAIITDLSNKPQCCKDSILSYCLLYPYTDNYMDNPLRDKFEKEHFAEFIYNIITDKTVVTTNSTEEKTKELLNIILSCYSGENKDTIVTLLSLILDAQKISTSQQQKKTINQDEILRILVYKGATSVLVDYFISNNSLEINDTIFYLKFGFFLQLLDDLQDIDEDLSENTATLFTAVSNKNHLEATVNKSFHFCHNSLSNFSPQNERLKSFLHDSCLIACVVAVFRNPRNFSKEYLDKMEPYLPFTAQYLYSKSTAIRKKNSLSDKKLLCFLDLWLATNL